MKKQSGEREWKREKRKDEKEEKEKKRKIITLYMPMRDGCRMVQSRALT